ncbi:type 2 lanthipeptide synthetase LanM [Zobellia sp. B3R18]|uniref:type 2 lanthipeptide synthetase LanM n=1 Tax=Zobellia sp. B3R18 TaxID=2841568 RepID=UPI001C07665C|nr:type 2 lanthipeptide synthetase LanM [Zobellia sp. B3R18]MBU2974977.1 type 2 lantipeptide synthetase LanM [Zobellia sp. B3R18]
MSDALFYQKIFLTSLLPYEKLKVLKRDENHFDNNSNQHNYLDLWKENICKDASLEAFEKYCEINNLNRDDIFLMTSRLSSCTNIIRLPSWMESLEKIINIINRENTKFDRFYSDIPFYELLFPFINFTCRELESNLTYAKINLPKSNVLEQIKKNLSKDLLEMSFSVFMDEFHRFLGDDNNKKCRITNQKDDFFYQKFVRQILKNRFRDLFLKYPMLARNMAVKTQKYIQFVSNIFIRFELDKEELTCNFNYEFNEIKKIHFNSGDEHNGGSTVIIEFNNTNKIVYKPSNIAISRAYNNFLEWVNSNLAENLKSFKVIDKKAYGWMEYIENVNCENSDDLKLYYKRAGIILGITYFLNSRDYHHENIIAFGNCPVLIDHETIIGPDIKFSNLNIKSGTVLESLLLPCQDEYRSESGFGLSNPSNKNSFFIKIVNCNKDNMIKVPQKRLINNQVKNLPSLDGNPVGLLNYKTQIEQGFRKFYDLILINKNLLLSKSSPIEYFRGFEIRHIVRSTSVYGKILHVLNNREYLSDSIKYGLKIEILARAYLKNENCISLLASEREQIINRDIPVFYTNSDMENLVLTNKNKVNIFQSSAIESIRDKIRKASRLDYTNQMKLIRKSLNL